jgi:hypothetical protein
MVQAAWEDQELADALLWHENAGHFRNDHTREAYEAGFRQGWGALRGALKSHGYIAVIDKPADGSVSIEVIR